jgi:hypothetical protein
MRSSICTGKSEAPSSHGTNFTLPRQSIFNLFEDQPDLFDATSYEVQNSVLFAIFEIFGMALEIDVKVRVTKENAGAISLRANE